MQNKISLSLAISLVVVSGVLGLTLGFYFSPTYTTTMYDKSEMGLGMSDRYLDFRYLDAMISHHEGAISLAKQVVTQSTRPEIRALATDIITNEPVAIDELENWKRAWYSDNRQITKFTQVNLGGSDDKLDLRFLNALISHHESGLIMTAEIRSKSSRSEVLDNADAVEAFLKDGLIVLRNWRKDWYGV